ncbi:Uncharacterised protein [Bordetella pertussis]|nr:Uncharacterised protein [Bordetella pertussis]
MTRVKGGSPPGCVGGWFSVSMESLTRQEQAACSRRS